MRLFYYYYNSYNNIIINYYINDFRNQYIYILHKKFKFKINAIANYNILHV